MRDLKLRLSELIDAGTSASIVAKAMGVSDGALSAWRKGSYKGNNDRIEQLVENYLDREQSVVAEFSEIKSDFDFVETSVYEDVRRGVELTDLRGEIRAVVGRSGVGKTTALK